jgi:hypothetical protein
MGTMSMMKQVVNETGICATGQRKLWRSWTSWNEDSAILFDELLLATKRA